MKVCLHTYRPSAFCVSPYMTRNGSKFTYKPFIML